MKVTNLSFEPEGVLRSWLPGGLAAERVVFLPDACPGKSPLPTGAAVLTRQADWRRFAVSDCGCGMRLLRSQLEAAELTPEVWDKVAIRIRQNKGHLGDLGGGNHFLDALLPYDEDVLYFLVHTGSREESDLVNGLVDSPVHFDREFDRVVEWAKANRRAIQVILENILGPMELVLDLPHNTFETLAEGVLIRKGAVRMHPGDVFILSSHMGGDAVLIRAMPRINELLCSMSHGTGRTMSRAEAKVAAERFDMERMCQAVLMPSFLKNTSLTTEGPYAYRDLDACLSLLAGCVEVIKRFGVIAYAGHL